MRRRGCTGRSGEVGEDFGAEEFDVTDARRRDGVRGVHGIADNKMHSQSKKKRRKDWDNLCLRNGT